MTVFRAIHLLLGVALLCLSACSYDQLSDTSIARLSRSSAARKPSSLIAWQERKDPHLEILKYTSARTSLLLTGYDRVSIVASRTSRGTLKFHVAMKSTKTVGAFGSAVPITRDGYFLTAEHCLGVSPLSLVVYTSGHRLQKVPARVVWKSSSASGVPDLAILHAPVKPFSPFVLANVSKMQPGEPVALAGWSKPHVNSLAAGRIMEVGTLQRGTNGIAWRSFRHSVPLALGDSGGPLIASDGKLVGINAQMSFSQFTALRILLGLDGSAKRPLSGYSCEASQPDRDWLKRTIALDRVARKTPSKAGGD